MPEPQPRPAHAGDPSPLERSGTFRVRFVSRDGEETTDRSPYPVEVIADRKPVVVLDRPGKDVTLPANGTLAGAGSPSLVGIAYLDASGSVDHVHVTGIRENDAGFGTQRNVGIYAANGAAGNDLAFPQRRDRPHGLDRCSGAISL